MAEEKRRDVLLWSLVIIITFSASLQAWSANKIVQVSERVSALESSNRFTPADELAIWQEINDLQTNVAVLAEQIHSKSK